MSQAGSIPEISQLSMVFGHIGGGALGWLKEHRIIHRNIRPGVILINSAAITMSRLTGFSEYCEEGSSAEGLPGSELDPWVSAGSEFRAPEMRLGQRYGNEVDIYSLSAVLSHMLLIRPCSQTAPSILPQDSYLQDLIERDLHAMPDRRLTSLDVQRELNCILGNKHAEWPPFGYTMAKRNISLKCDRRHGEDFMKRKSLRAALKALQHSGNLEVVDFSNLKWAIGSDK